MDKSSRSDPGPSPSPSLYPLGLASQVENIFEALPFRWKIFLRLCLAGGKYFWGLASQVKFFFEALLPRWKLFWGFASQVETISEVMHLFRGPFCGNHFHRNFFWGLASQVVNTICGPCPSCGNITFEVVPLIWEIFLRYCLSFGKYFWDLASNLENTILAPRHSSGAVQRVEARWEIDFVEFKLWPWFNFWSSPWFLIFLALV